MAGRVLPRCGVELVTFASRAEMYAQTVYCYPCREHINKYRRKRHEMGRPHQKAALEAAYVPKPEPVSEEMFRLMLLQVLMAVKPETIADRMGYLDGDPSKQSPSATRSMRYRAKKALINPYKVQVGQMWRRGGKDVNPIFEVRSIEGSYAYVDSGFGQSKIRLDRFTPEYQGYERLNISLAASAVKKTTTESSI